MSKIILLYFISTLNGLMQPLYINNWLKNTKVENLNNKNDVLDSIYLEGFVLKITKSIPRVRNERFHLDKRIILFYDDSLPNLKTNSIDSLILTSKHLLITRYELNNIIIDNKLNHLEPILSPKCDSILIPQTTNNIEKRVNGDRYKLNMFRMQGMFYLVRINRTLFIDRRWWLPNHITNFESVDVLVPKWR